MRVKRRLLKLEVGIEPSQRFTPECLPGGQRSVKNNVWALTFLLKRFRFLILSHLFSWKNIDLSLLVNIKQIGLELDEVQQVRRLLLHSWR